MAFVPCHPRIDACIFLAPATLEAVEMASAKSLVQSVSVELPVHVFIPDGESEPTSSSWDAAGLRCHVHRLPAAAGSTQTRALADQLHELRILRPWVILWEPSFLHLAMRVYAPAKAWVAGPWLAANAAALDPVSARIDLHLRHIFLARIADMVFLADHSAERFLRKELGYYGKLLPRETWETQWKDERDAAIAQRAAQTPHYSHKLEILVEMETPTLKESTHATFINHWMQCSRHRVQICRHQEEASQELALRHREEFDVLLRACESASSSEDWKSWQSLSSYKMMLVSASPSSVEHEAWAKRHGVHQVLSIASLAAESDLEIVFDEMLSRTVHGLQHWALQQPGQYLHHGMEATPAPMGKGGLDEVFEHQVYGARVLPSELEHAHEVVREQREVIDRLNDQIAELEKGGVKAVEGKSRILRSLKKRVQALFR